MKKIKQLFKQINQGFKHAEPDDQEKILNYIENLAIKADNLGQKRMVRQLSFEYALRKRELTKVYPEGFKDYIEKQGLIDLINKLKKENATYLSLARIEDYIHPIPDSESAIIRKANGIFDNLYILFTDYTNTTKKEIQKEKDPIVFGTLSVKSDKDRELKESTRLYYITDWEDEYCDLTLDKLLDLSHEVGQDLEVKNGQKLLISQLKRELYQVDQSNANFDRVVDDFHDTRRW